jgi:hypothetical protein
LFFILGYSLEGLQVLKKFLNSKHEEVFHPIFLAQMVLSPLNSIVDDFLIRQYETETEIHFTKEMNKKRKLHVLFRFDILCRMLDILGEFGTRPIFEKQSYVSKLINSKDFGLNATGSREDSPAFVTGFTSAFFLTLPELFKMWVQQKDGDSENVNNYQILEFVGQQCLWPTFMNPNRMTTDTSNGQVKQGIGTMISNAKSEKPYSFLPEVFDLKKLFKQCLDGAVEWRTPSLCEEPQIIQSPKDSATTEKTPEDEREKEDATEDTSVENAAQDSDEDEDEVVEKPEEVLEEEIEEDAQEEEESGYEDSQEEEADNDDEEDDEQEKKPKAKKRKMSNQAKAKKKKKSEQEVQDVDCSLDHFLEEPYNGTDIRVDIINLLDYLEVNVSQNEYLAGLVQNVEQWKSGEIFAFPRNWDDEEE